LVLRVVLLWTRCDPWRAVLSDGDMARDGPGAGRDHAVDAVDDGWRLIAAVCPGRVASRQTWLA
jgi:hypothetical protein